MDLINLSQLWTAAAVLTGFQVTALSWRIKRELTMEAKGEKTWLTLADFLVGGSFLVLVFGVFASPIFGTVTISVAAKLFGIALILFTSSTFVLAGHYDLYCEWGKQRPRKRVTKQERTAFGGSILLMLIYVVWWMLA